MFNLYEAGSFKAANSNFIVTKSFFILIMYGRAPSNTFAAFSPHQEPQVFEMTREASLCISSPRASKSETDSAKGQEQHKCPKMLLARPLPEDAKQEGPAEYVSRSLSLVVIRRRTSRS